MKKFLIMMLGIAAIFTSCSDSESGLNLDAFSDYDDLTLSAISADGASTIFSFVSTEAWSVSVATRSDIAAVEESWITVTPSSGEAGYNEISITIDPNEDEDSRSATISIFAGSSEMPISVTQSGAGVVGGGNDELYQVKQLIFYRNDGSNMKQIINIEYDDQDRATRFEVQRWYFYDDEPDMYRHTQSYEFTYEDGGDVSYEVYTDYDESAYSDDLPYQLGSFTLENGLVVSSTMYSTDNCKDEYSISSEYTYNTNGEMTYFNYESIYSSETHKWNSTPIWSNGSCVGITSSYTVIESGELTGNGYTTSEELSYSSHKNLTNMDINAYIDQSEGLPYLYEDIMMLMGYDSASRSSEYLLSSATEQEEGDLDLYSWSYSYEFNSNGAPTAVNVAVISGSTDKSYRYEISYVE